MAPDALVLDDASSDGTSDAIAVQFPDVTVLHGDGELCWNGGMRRASAAAMRDRTNGDATLISQTTVQRMGNIDPALVQQMGDFDYGLRARPTGCSVWAAPGTVGICAHPERGPDELASWAELRRLWSRQQLQPGPWVVYCRRWAGRLWPLYRLSPYARGGMRLIRQRMPLARRAAV
jgi:GT2 family glycosyltransferase